MSIARFKRYGVAVNSRWPRDALTARTPSRFSKGRTAKHKSGGADRPTGVASVSWVRGQWRRRA